MRNLNMIGRYHMIRHYQLVFLLACGPVNSYAQSWHHLTLPAYNDMVKDLAAPPAQYDQTMDYGLGRNMTQETMSRELDSINKQGINAISIEGTYGTPEPYLSAGYMEGVKVLVAELKKRGMHMWIIDEGQYPSGFAGGLISKKAPEYRMQGIVVAGRIRLGDHESISNQVLPPQVISAVAVNDSTRESRIIDVHSGSLNWAGISGKWQITLAEHRFKTSVTRSATNPTHGKDTANSLIDYLDPAATGKFLEFTHEQYKKYIGDEFGKTVLGFRGDEPEYNFTPWSPALLEIFKAKKGYDITPYLASFLTRDLNDEERLAKADFWDVWSDLFRDNFFKVEADWCVANGLEYIVHIDHEEKLMDLVRTEGDYFKDMRYVQIPGVDAIWHQIWYDNVDDYPKIASSAAHMYGRARSFSESFAAYRPVPTVSDVRWVINEEMVRGINLFEYMHWGSPYIKDPAFLPVSLYSNRATWLLANGIPAATVGVYCPTESMWLGNQLSDSTLKVISRKLLEHQVDFDYVDRQGIANIFKLDKGVFTNLSGQGYSTIIIPTVSVMNSDVLARLKVFASQGGKVLFIGDLPGKVADPNFRNAGTAPDLSWAAKADWQNLNEDFFARLPHDLQLDKAAPDVKYLHRRWKDADLYFFFNEGKEKQELKITVDGAGQAKIWDADTGKVGTLAGAVKKGSRTTMPLLLNGYETVFLIIKH